MADGDDQFKRGVQDGFDDAPHYTWQDPFYQERYDAGYLIGRWSWTVQRERRANPPITPTQWEAFEAMMKRRGWVKDR